jgi:hypothetical protein
MRKGFGSLALLVQEHGSAIRTPAIFAFSADAKVT